MVAMIQKFGMLWTIYSINIQRLSANHLYLFKSKYKVKTMFKWWMCIVSRPQGTTLISQLGQHTLIPLQWRHNERNGISIIGVSSVYSTVCSGVDQRKYQSSAVLAFVRGIHRWPLNSAHKGKVIRKMFPFSSCTDTHWGCWSAAKGILWNTSRQLCKNRFTKQREPMEVFFRILLDIQHWWYTCHTYLTTLCHVYIVCSNKKDG